MNKNIVLEIRSKLFSLQDKKYQEFHSKLCPGVNNIIGVRVPVIKKIVKDLLKEDYISYIKDDNKEYYEEIMIEGLLISQAKLPFYEKQKYLDKFIPKINHLLWTTLILKLMEVGNMNFWVLPPGGSSADLSP